MYSTAQKSWSSRLETWDSKVCSSPSKLESRVSILESRVLSLKQQGFLQYAVYVLYLIIEHALICLGFVGGFIGNPADMVNVR